MSYTIHSDYLSASLEATTNNNIVTLSNEQTFTFESDGESNVFFLVQDGRKTPIIATFEGRNTVKLSVNGYNYVLDVLSERDQYFAQLLKATATATSGTMKVAAPMPGLLKTIAVQNGQHVKKGERLFILEAMKMENDIKAPTEGIVTGLNVNAGTAVEKGFPLCMIEAAKTS